MAASDVRQRAYDVEVCESVWIKARAFRGTWFDGVAVPLYVMPGGILADVDDGHVMIPWANVRRYRVESVAVPAPAQEKGKR